MGTAAKVLIAEQDQSVIRLLKTVLSNAGHRVVLAKDGEKALQSFEEYAIDLALIDVDLKGARGIDLARKIRKDHPAVSVAFLCYFGTARSAIAAADAGVDRFILKPFDDLAAVNRTIKEILAERHDRLRRAAASDGEAESSGEGKRDENAAKVRVIVADSVKDDRLQMGEALEKLNCEVTYASCAQEALLHLSSDEHDVLVIAYDMGDMTADDVLLRARRFDELVSVVVTSPSPTLAQTTSLIKKGASGFIEKPLKDPGRTAESIVRRGVAVMQLRKEVADDEEEDEAGDEGEPDDGEQPAEAEGASQDVPREGFRMTDDEDVGAEGDEPEDEARDGEDDEGADEDDAGDESEGDAEEPGDDGEDREDDEGDEDADDEAGREDDEDGEERAEDEDEDEGGEEAEDESSEEDDE